MKEKAPQRSRERSARQESELRTDLDKVSGGGYGPSRAMLRCDDRVSCARDSLAFVPTWARWPMSPALMSRP